MGLRVFLCDDEPLALDRLRGMLTGLPDVEIVGQALHGRALLDTIVAAAPTLVFLDIEMPQLDGFDVVDALARLAWPDAPPLIIFVTAHTEHAAEAFDSGALDFISKPVRLSRLEQAIARARTAVEQAEARRRFADLSRQLDELKRLHVEAEPEPAERGHIWVRAGLETMRLDMGDVEWIAAEGEYVRFHAGAASYLERGSLTDAVAQFAASGFVRVHRSAAVNRALVVAVERARWGALTLRMRSGERIPVGKKHRAAIQAMIGAAAFGGRAADRAD